MRFDNIFNDEGRYVLRFTSEDTPKLIEQHSIEKGEINFSLRVFSDGSVRFSAQDKLGNEVKVDPVIINLVFNLKGTPLELYYYPITVNYVAGGLLQQAFYKLNRQYAIKDEFVKLHKKCSNYFAK